MTIMKLKCKDGKTLIRWTQSNGGGIDEHELITCDAPAPEFSASLEALGPVLVDICELPADYGSGLTVTGVTLSYTDDGERGVTITGLKTLAKYDAPLVINTPHVREMSTAHSMAVDAVIDACEAFIAGERAQMELPA